MRELLLVGAGGFVGAVLRHFVAVGLAHLAFPAATLVVNVVGSFCLGLVAALLDRGVLDPMHKHALAVGLLGALTTFSTFSVETIRLLENGAHATAILSVAANIVLALAAAWIGLRLAG